MRTFDNNKIQVLIVEDSEDDTLLLVRELKRGGYEPLFNRVDQAEAMSAALEQGPWDLIIADYNMRGFTGMDALRLFRKKDLDIPFLLVSGTISEDIAVEAMKAGAHDYIAKNNLIRLIPAVHREIKESRRRRESLKTEDKLYESEERFKAIFQTARDSIYIKDEHLRYQLVNPAMVDIFGVAASEFIGRTDSELFGAEYGRRSQEEDERVLQGQPVDGEHTRLIGGILKTFDIVKVPMRDRAGRIIGVCGIAREITERKQAEIDLRLSAEKLKSVMKGTIMAMVTAVEMRDPYTAGHEKRVAKLGAALARGLALPEKDIEGIELAAAIHDVGKMYVPAEILSKPTRLNDVEMSLVKVHAQAGYEILKDINFPWPVAEIVLEHHERLNGSGYPRGLKGDAILPGAKILAIADVVEAMASHRPYRPALGIEKALDEIHQNRDILYDPDAADACIRLFQDNLFSFD